MTNRISLRDEAALTWYFLHGERAFEKSTHGAIEDHLTMSSMGSGRCRVCGGVGILETHGAVRRHKERGKTTERRRKWRVVEKRKRIDCGVNMRAGGPVVVEEEVDEWGAVGIGSECQCCRGTGVVPTQRGWRRCGSCARKVTKTTREDGVVVLEKEPDGEWRERRRLCVDCEGTGRARPTVHRTGQREEYQLPEIGGDVFRSFAKVNRRLRRLRPQERGCLELYYGAYGQSWADQPGGRLLALQPATDAGRTLLRRTRRKGDEATGASPAERMAAQIDLQTRKPELWRRKLLCEAEEQARALYIAAAKAWTATSGLQDEMEILLRSIRRTGDAYEDWLDRNWEQWWFDPCWGDPHDESGVAA